MLGLPSLAARTGAAAVLTLALPGLTATAAAAVAPTVSEGLEAAGVPAWHAAGHRGEGVTVAVLDIGFAGLADVPVGDLPAGVATMAFDGDGVLDDGTDHGTQMLEIVHDVAPGADLMAVTFDDGRFAEAVAWLNGAGVDVVSFSMEWTEGPFDGTHWSSAVIRDSVAAGVTWVVAAGNSAEEHHNGTTVDADGDGWVEVTSGGVEHNAFMVDANTTADVTLSWADPATALELCLFDLVATTPTGQPVLLACDDTVLDPDRSPTRSMALANESATAHRYGYGVLHRSGPRTTYEGRTWRTGPLAYSNPAASVSVPGNVAEVVTVGAVAWDTLTLQPYSAWGPNHMGDRKPDVVGPDVVSTSTWAGPDNTGTSYAAPHVAGLAALILGAQPDLTPAGIQQRLVERASLAATPDYRHGWGLARLGRLPSTIAALRGHWAEVAVDRAFATGLTAGCPTGAQLTCPDLAVTRDEMAGFLWAHRGRPAATAPAGFADVGFVDANGASTHGPAIDWLAGAGITLGCTATAFCPTGTVTRAEMAAFLWRLEGSPAGSTPANFADVPDGFFAGSAIDWLLAAGITTGCTTTTFCPDGLVTRAEVFTFLHRLAG